MMRGASLRGGGLERTDWSNALAKILFDKELLSIKIRSESELESLMAQSKANKVLARTLPCVEGVEPAIKARIEIARAETQHHLDDALKLLASMERICLELDVSYAVIKSLDALPDIGHDLDLLVGKNVRRVQAEIQRRFKCSGVTLTFCDRQAGKYSTFVEGFYSDLELYARISQLGEDYYPTERVLERRSEAGVLHGGTYVCSQEDKLLITCIHTLYRHGKIRLSDLNVAYEAFNGPLDTEYLLRTVKSAGIERGFAVFLAILERAVRGSLRRDPLPPLLERHVRRILNSDPLLAILVTRTNLRFPLKVPVGITGMLFLYKAAADLAHAKRGSFLRSSLAPVLLLVDKIVPLRVQKAVSIRIW